MKKRKNIFKYSLFNLIAVVALFALPRVSQADQPYKMNIILDKITYEAEPMKPHKVDNDLWRRYILFASFHVEGLEAVRNRTVSCQVKFLQDSPERDDWDNVVHPQWVGLIGDWFRMNAGGGVRSGLSLNTSILPNGGTFPCSVGVRPSEAGIAPSALEVAGKTVGGNVITLRQPPLINEDWMAELLLPSSEKFYLIINGYTIPGNQVGVTLERNPSKSHMHSGNFKATKWIKHWFRGKEMIEGFANWPAF